MEKKRFLEIDLMKIISCLAVIGIHITARGVADPAAQGTAHSVSLFFNALTYFAVPSFIFLSGLALMLRYGGRPLPFMDFMKRRMHTILVPYLGWSFTYFIIYALAGYYAFNLNNILSVIFLGTGEYHLYFVVILFQLYLLFPFLKAAAERIGTPLSLALALGVHLAFSQWPPPLPHMDRIFVPYLVFFVSGMAWGSHYAAMKTWIRRHPGIIGFIYLISAGLYIQSRMVPESSAAWMPQLWQSFSLVSILMLMAVSAALTAKIKTPEQLSGVITLSAATFYVYLAHPFFIAGFYKVFDDIGFHGLGAVLPVTYGLVTVLSFWGALEYLKYKKRHIKAPNPRKA